MILTGDETILAGGAMFIAPPASFSAAGAMKSAGEFTDRVGWCSYASVLKGACAVSSKNELT